MLTNDKVSVIIPIYNSEKFLRDSLESVLEQTYSNVEIICVDDGSTDKSPEILKQYSDKIIILTQKNQGLASALNTGIKAMTGVWFKWFSPDDILHPQAIEILVKKANELGGNYIIYSNWEIIDENNKHLRNFSESNYNDLNKFDFNVRLLDGQQINVNTTLIPANLFGKYKIQNLQDPVAIDYDFFLNAALNFSTKFFLVNKSLIKYRIHTNQLSHKNIVRTLSFINNLKKEYLKKLDDKTREKYIQGLDEYNKEKPITKKTMEIGLSLLSKFPKEISDKILVYYLNQLRSNR